jgi:hypothetical protein
MSFSIPKQIPKARGVHTVTSANRLTVPLKFAVIPTVTSNCVTLGGTSVPLAITPRDTVASALVSTSTEAEAESGAQPIEVLKTLNFLSNEMGVSWVELSMETLSGKK